MREAEIGVSWKPDSGSSPLQPVARQVGNYDCTTAAGEEVTCSGMEATRRS